MVAQIINSNGYLFKLPGRRIRKSQKWYRVQPGDHLPENLTVARGEWSGNRYYYYLSAKPDRRAIENPKYLNTHVFVKNNPVQLNSSSMRIVEPNNHGDAVDGGRLASYITYVLVDEDDPCEFNPQRFLDKEFEEAFV